jgi:hypothetical protein
MSYTVVFGTTDSLSAAEAPTAKDALAIIKALENDGEKIRFVTSPQEGEIGVEMLRILAKEEDDEFARSPFRIIRASLRDL